MPKITKIVLLIILAGLLVLIRAYEDSIFYDPLLGYFKAVQEYPTLPEFDTFNLIINLAFRYALNTIISIAILWVIFQNKDIIKLSVILYGLLFIILFVVFYLLLFSSESVHNLALFYVRRFLIQPIFLLILVPAFYFQKKIN
jgi:exosortase F-associated protein